MHIVAAVLALLLLVIVLSPIILRRVRLARRERAVHRDGGCHWYANYDEDLRYEPHSHADIVRLPREDVLHKGYRPTEDVQIVPRTFRHRVPGDVKIRLWKNGDPNAIALWLCEWAMNPVRVAIGVGERASVPGVESGRVPVDARNSQEPARIIEASDWARSLEDSVAPKDAGHVAESDRDELAGEVSNVSDSLPEGIPIESENAGVLRDGGSLNDGSPDDVGSDDGSPDATSGSPETSSSEAHGTRRSRRRRH